MEVRYCGNLNDRISREILIIERNGKLVVRRIRRKITMSEAFKSKYLKATTIEHTDQRSTALQMIESVNWRLMAGSTVPACTLIIDGKRHHYSCVSGQWWDIEMVKYWNKRLSDVIEYRQVRKLDSRLEIIDDHVWLVFSKEVADNKSESVSYKVYRNNDVFLELNKLELHPKADDSIYYNTALFPVSDLNEEDAYVLEVEKHSRRYRFRDGNLREYPKYVGG